jgi:asparagine synthase (glutamine-hydrolysing)
MCGIAAYVRAGCAWDDLHAYIGRMNDTVAHRGPDGHGIWVDEAHGVALGHRRLSIIDLSPAGGQPMESGTGRWVIVFNGEIYNYREMREQLEALGNAIPWTGSSDTEVLLAGFEEWGVRATLQRAVGMFAFAAWDRRERRLVVARDRLGKKPLYYGLVNGAAVISSELNQVRALSGSDLEVDREALALFTRYRYIPEPWTIYRSMRKLMPGTLLDLKGEGLPRILEVEPEPYWSLSPTQPEPMLGGRTKNAGAHQVEELRARVIEAVRIRLRADVPVGSFLSGGIDSSLVTAIAQSQAGQRIRTFSMGFTDPSFDESPASRNVAEYLGTDHSEWVLAPEDLLPLVEDVLRVYDEPFADASQLPTMMLARLAHEQVKVVLTGDGGDEVFGGYNRYTWGRRLWSVFRAVPLSVRRPLCKRANTLSVERVTGMLEAVQSGLPNRYRVNRLGPKLEKALRLIDVEGPRELHLRLATYWRPEEQVVAGVDPPATPAEKVWEATDRRGALEAGLKFDTLQTLPGDMLVKVDRATMSVGLEARQPLLDHRIVELAQRMPAGIRFRGGESKWPLRMILRDFVPDRLWARPKMGFDLPLGSWLRGPLRPWAQELLSDESLRATGVFDPSVVQAEWRRHLDGRCDAGDRLWIVLVAQKWLRQNA